MERTYPLIWLTIALLAACQTHRDPPRPLSAEPSILGLATISRPDRHEFCSVLSRDRRTAYIGIEHGEWQSIVSYTWDGSGWAGPEHVLGSPNYSAQDPSLSLDESRLYFTTRTNGQADLGFLERTPTGEWGDPVLLSPPVNSTDNEYYTSFTERGDIVFASDRDRTQRGDYNIYRAPFVDGVYGDPIPFPDGINTLGYEADPFIDPAGRYLVFASNRPGGQGRGDLYLSIARQGGDWSEPIAFDNTINTPGHELCPMVTLDGSALLFTRDQDIYWVSTAVINNMIDDYKSQVFD